MRILVLGGTRFIGPPAVEQLVKNGHEVAVFHRGESKAALPPEVQHIYGDRSQLDSFIGIFARFAPDVVLDTIAFTAADGEKLLNVFNGIAARLVILSSCDVYLAYDRLRKISPGTPIETPLTEASPLREKLFPYRQDDTPPEDFAYSYEKILLERAVQSAPTSLPTTVLRLPMVYGPGDYQHRLKEYVQQMDSGAEEITLSHEMANWIAPRGYVEDMGHAIALCVTKPEAAGGIYHVADLHPVTEREWVQQIASAANWFGTIREVPASNLAEDKSMDLDFSQNWSLDSSCIRQELGYREIVDTAEAVRKSVEWERSSNSC